MDSCYAIYFSICFIVTAILFIETAIAEKLGCHKKMMFYTRFGGGCCKDLPYPDKKWKTLFYDCAYAIPKPTEEWTPCRTDECMAKKQGFLNEDLTLNKIALKNLVEKEFKDNPKRVTAILEKCINGDIQDYGDAYWCQLTKMRFCIELNSAMACTDWKEDEDRCANINKTIEECKQVV